MCVIHGLAMTFTKVVLALPYIRQGVFWFDPHCLFCVEE
jgi:hypothetical protein